MNTVIAEMERRLTETSKIEDIDVRVVVFCRLTDMILKLQKEDVIALVSSDVYRQANKDLEPYLTYDDSRLEECGKHASVTITDEQRKLIEEIPNGKS